MTYGNSIRYEYLIANFGVCSLILSLRSLHTLITEEDLEDLKEDPNES